MVSQTKEALNIFWFRRDLRLEDNHGLYKACMEGTTLPIFIFDTNILKHLDIHDARVTYIHFALTNLQMQLQAVGKGLKIYYGNVLSSWETILTEYNIRAVYTNKDYEPYALKRDNRVSNLLSNHHIKLYRFKDQVIFEEDDILKSNGKPYTVYTPYKNQWLKQFSDNSSKTFPSEEYIHKLLSINTTIPNLSQLGFRPSNIRVKPFQLRSLKHYDKVRDYPALDQTSNLSVFLRFGTFSIRKAINLALKTNTIWLNELIWRSFFKQILFHFPHVVNKPFKIQYTDFPWRNNEEEFKRWCNGETGYPLVDAGMKELNATGYMHNRVRMVCASFLCKHLLIDWRWGETYFARKLLDYDLSANSGNWQWAASTGCDAVPYFRIFNPETQIKRFDSDLLYIRKWIKNYDKTTYLNPIVDHKMARERCLETFKHYLNNKSRL